MLNITELNDLKPLFDKRCTNLTPAYEYRKTSTGEITKVPRLYKRADLSQWAEEAFNKGEDFFYCGENENGILERQEPKYVYKLNITLTEEEFEKIFSK